MLFFCLFQCFKETEYQTESKQNETFGNMIFSPNVIQETWTLLQGIKEVVTRVGARPPGHAPLPRGPAVAPPTYSFLLYIPTYPQTIRYVAKNLIPCRNLLYSRDPILGPVPELRRKRAVITEGFYIILAPPMKCE